MELHAERARAKGCAYCNGQIGETGFHQPPVSPGIVTTSRPLKAKLKVSKLC